MRRSPAMVLLLASALAALAPTATPAEAGEPKATGGPPFDVNARTPHRITATIDTQPARDVLVLLTGSEGAPAALRRLKASAAARAALRAEETSAEDFWGRLVTAATGTPDSLLAGYRGEASSFRALLDQTDHDAPGTAPLLAARIASLLPDEPPLTVSIVLVPFIGVGGFREISSLREEGSLYLAVDLPRLVGSTGALQPREAFLKMLRGAGAESWRVLLAAYVRKTPPWPAADATSLDALLALTAAEGPAALFQIPDEFFPLDPFFAEPVGRAFHRWNETAEKLLDPATKEVARRELLREALHGEFWAQYPAIVGAQMAEILIRQKGRAATVAAFEAGPRAFARLYAETVTGTKKPAFSKPVKKALEAKAP
ncbi:MAG: hypothetical protein ACHQPI_00525 [Thermoanaerobaculia bacterium]